MKNAILWKLRKEIIPNTNIFFAFLGLKNLLYEYDWILGVIMTILY